MCYFTVVSLILQAPFTLDNVTSHPNHHKIKMFPFNVIKDNNNIPTEKTACIQIWYKCIISCWKDSIVSPPPQHAALRSTFHQKPLHGKAPLDSPSLPPASWGSSFFSFPWSGPCPDSMGMMLRAQLSLLLDRGFLLCLFFSCPYSQAEKNYRMAENSFIRGFWQLFPPILVIFKGKAGAVVKRPVGGEQGNDLLDFKSIIAQSGQP